MSRQHHRYSTLYYVSAVLSLVKTIGLNSMTPILWVVKDTSCQQREKEEEERKTISGTAHRAPSQHRHFQHEIQQAESLFEETYGHTHDVENVSLDITKQLPDIELLSSTFRKRLLALEGLDAELTESGAATAGLLVHMPSGGVFRRSSTGARVYVSHDRPEPSGGVSKDPLLDTIRLMKDFATGDETIKGLTVPSWLRVQGFPAQLDAQIDASTVEQSPVLTRLVEDLRLRPAETHTAKYWLDQRACSLAGQLAARSRASSSSSLPKKLIYLGVGIDDDRVKMLYVGKTIRGYTRIAEHAQGYHADISAAREGIQFIRSLLSDRTQTLALSGKLEYRWRLGKDARVKCLEYELKTEDKTQLQGMMLEGEDEILVRVRVRLGASLPQSDLFLGCTEEDRSLYQGIVLEIGAAGADKFPHKVQIFHVPSLQALRLWRTKSLKLQAGVAPLNQFICLVLDEDSRLFSWLADPRDRVAVAEIFTTLGFGLRAWTDHNYPQTFARLVTGGTELYDFSHGTASRLPHLAQEEAFELRLLAFDNSWMRCPRRITPMAYQTPEAQLRNGASFTAFLNAGSEMLGLPLRNFNYLPPGFEASGDFSYKVSGKTEHGTWRYNRCGGLYLIGGVAYLDSC
ncbi:hypothetical protein BCV69DRAFT_277425 [Microstroma glucosiphilum]|uniref:GIY-YIG domain-containing protein n=1 Tax=Pseudomicrostroma glucosiphilum TaxID=1684307 RepID=A0A316U6A4_9BASI|nr:hypothetical protein BCV69DRAFT_277425 [Pseudomicrostroma glucosiphilum]PWN20759.1 hypothetical protein BCV69DRAFT_277425 [Pseudomicrostroma glucosiphilum]